MEHIEYNGQTYFLNNIESSQLKTELEELDFYTFGDTDQKSSWIVFKFLRDHGYEVEHPDFPEPWLATDLFDMSRSDGAGLEYQHKLIKSPKQESNSAEFPPVFSLLAGDLDTKAHRQGLVTMIVVLGIMLMLAFSCSLGRVL